MDEVNFDELQVDDSYNEDTMSKRVNGCQGDAGFCKRWYTNEHQNSQWLVLSHTQQISELFTCSITLRYANAQTR